MHTSDRKLLQFWFNALAAMSALVPAAGDSASRDDFTNYVVSWSGRYLFAVTDDSRQNPPLHQIFVIETAHSDQKTVIGDYECKGFGGVGAKSDPDVTMTVRLFAYR